MTFLLGSPIDPNRPPLDFTAEQARKQLVAELAKPQYQAARPSPIEAFLKGLAQQISDWLNSLFGHAGVVLPGGSTPIVLIIVIVVVAAIVIAFLVFGVPRINRRSARRGTLFGEDDDRDSDSLRRSAERAAASGDFAAAVEEGFRSIARRMAERAILAMFPGTTAHSFAIQAIIAFPSLHAEFVRAADTFDAVRYLGASATEQDWLSIKTLEAHARSARPVLETVDA
jgi:hypothetical protein